jgi:hypothetical protein
VPEEQNVVGRVLKTRQGQPRPDCPCPSPRSGILSTAPAVARVASTRDGQVLPCILQQKSPKCIGHLEDSAIGQVSNLFIGQVSNLSIGQMSNLFTGQAINLCRSARAIASARLETPNLDRMLLT